GVTGVRRERGHHLAEQRRIVLDQRDQAGDRPRGALAGAPGEGADVPRGASAHAWGTRTISASPCPPPPHSAAAPTPPPRRLSSRARCSTIRAPDMPTGWPSAIAPPWTFTLDSSRPRARVESMPTAANASLNSTRSRSVGAMPSLSQASLVALAG